MSSFDDRGQYLHCRGLYIGFDPVGVLFLIFQLVSVVTPQTEMSADMKSSQKAADTLICRDGVTRMTGAS